jgi:hypothetical protein
MFMMIRTYSELIRSSTFEGRFKYLALRGGVGDSTFGFDRYINQMFYASREWKQARQHVILRDNGCDLGVDGYEIHDRLYVHHMNPMEPEDVFEGNLSILDPEFLITTSHTTHNAIHYGDERQLPKPIVERKRGDTKLW